MAGVPAVDPSQGDLAAGQQGAKQHAGRFGCGQDALGLDAALVWMTYAAFGHGSSSGIVRLTGHELADQKRSRLSRGELTPFSERGSAVLLEDIAAVEVAVLVEVVVDRGMGGGEFLQGLYISELNGVNSPRESLDRF